MAAEPTSDDKLRAIHAFASKLKAALSEEALAAHMLSMLPSTLVACESEKVSRKGLEQNEVHIACALTVWPCRVPGAHELAHG